MLTLILILFCSRSPIGFQFSRLLPCFPSSYLLQLFSTSFLIYSLSDVCSKPRSKCGGADDGGHVERGHHSVRLERHGELDW
jgi:hypothetical protein